jgi:hypothetical protein
MTKFDHNVYFRLLSTMAPHTLGTDHLKTVRSKRVNFNLSLLYCHAPFMESHKISPTLVSIYNRSFPSFFTYMFIIGVGVKK